SSRLQYPELDKQVAMAERIVVTKKDLADPGPVIAFLKEMNPHAELVDAISRIFSTHGKARKPVASIATLGPIRNREHFSGIRAYAFRPPSPVTWAGWSAWSRLVAAEFGARLIRVKGLLKMEDTGEIAFVQGVQGVFHAPQRFDGWPDDDQANRLVCIARDLNEQDIAATLPALNTPAGTQAVYSLKDLQERQAQQ
ncbi:MAG TPA: GTP-binding protein, partial [Burkholderiales bacterium]